MACGPNTAAGDLEACTEFVGVLSYRDVDNMPSLRNLTGALIVINSQRESLSSLACLEVIGGALRLIGNPQLVTIGMPALREVGGPIDANGDTNPLLDVCELGELAERTGAFFTGETCACVSGSFRVRNAADLEQWPSCERLSGGLSITGPDVTDLTPFSGLTQIDGCLDVSGEATELRTVSGLSSLRTVGGDVSFRVSQVTSLAGLDSLETIGGTLDLGQTVIPSLAGLGSLRSIGGSLLLINNELPSFAGLDALETIGGSFEVVAMFNLGSSDGLGSLSSVGEGLLWDDILRLSTLRGLSSLNSVGGPVQISGIPDLVSLQGLESLRDVGGNLLVSNNAGLNSVSALAGLEQVGLVTITDNASLDVCDAQALCDEISDVSEECTATNSGVPCS